MLPVCQYRGQVPRILWEPPGRSAAQISQQLQSGPSVDRSLPRMRSSSYHSQSAAYLELRVRAPIGSSRQQTTEETDRGRRTAPPASFWCSRGVLGTQKPTLRALLITPKNLIFTPLGVIYAGSPTPGLQGHAGRARGWRSFSIEFTVPVALRIILLTLYFMFFYGHLLCNPVEISVVSIYLQ